MENVIVCYLDETYLHIPTCPVGPIGEIGPTGLENDNAIERKDDGEYGKCKFFKLSE